MFFMFYILVAITFFGEISSSANRAGYPQLTDYFKENAKSFIDDENTKDYPIYEQQETTTTQNPMFHIIDNLTSSHSNNLKSNVFDKMLSDEMFSMKQRFFEKDLAYTTTTVHRVTKSNVATPTLELKQKWQAVDQFTITPTEPTITKDENSADAIPDVHQKRKSKSKLNNDPKIKSLDVRSLSGHPEMKCNCANANGNHQCKHGDDCTRKSGTITTGDNAITTTVQHPAFYMPYQSYFISDNNPNLFQNMNYHPQVINELKIPRKTKPRKPTSTRDVDLYYDDYKETKRPPTQGDIIMNIDYDIEDSKSPAAPNCLHEELQEVFNKGVQRKCYCSSSHTISPHLITFIVLISLIKMFV